MSSRRTGSHGVAKQLAFLLARARARVGVIYRAAPDMRRGIIAGPFPGSPRSERAHAAAARACELWPTFLRGYRERRIHVWGEKEVERRRRRASYLWGGEISLVREYVHELWRF